MERKHMTSIFAIGIYIVITLPHISFMLFDWGVKYSLHAMFICFLISIIVGYVIAHTGDNYTPYTHLRNEDELEEIIEQENPEGNTDHVDVNFIHTGKYYTIHYEVWVAYHKKTGLPKYKRIKLNS